ncbi:MAG: heat-shock protein Hsp20 [Gammaproteobacteria bacterium RIFCSPLOWO2_02_FULL_52_10]|nr:MAG: heat-shock protein Hsp20 [Gammaproteobacteria bacterium RIFCSPLOWO2_02_FULL_52_10]
MSLVRYEPFNLFDRFQKEFTRMGLLDPLVNEVLSDDNTDVAISHWRPAVDIKEEDNRFLIRADIPGVDPKDIEITMEEGVLTIKGERTSEKDEKREDYRRVERSRGTFYRRFSLPDTADAEKIVATGKDGVLELVIPKHDKVLPRRITIKS